MYVLVIGVNDSEDVLICDYDARHLNRATIQCPQGPVFQGVVYFVYVESKGGQHNKCGAIGKQWLRDILKSLRHIHSNWLGSFIRCTGVFVHHCNC